MDGRREHHLTQSALDKIFHWKYKKYVGEPIMSIHDSQKEDIFLLDQEKLQRRVEKQLAAHQNELRLKDEKKLNSIKETLSIHQRHLRTWKPRYDFELWHQTENSFEHIWPELNKALNLAIEYELYDLVKSFFFDIRHLLQTTGHIKERIYLATWVKNQAEKRKDLVAMNLAISSLIWSHTSAGKHRDLDKAASLWKSLKPFREQTGDPSYYNDYRQKLLKQTDPSLYIELLMDIYESGVRLAVRRMKFKKASKYITQGRDEISVLAQEGYMPKRLKERFDLAFTYHEGVASYLKGDKDEACQAFNNVIHDGELISWTRAVRGAKSWQATLAMERKDYDLCEAILREITEEHPALLRKRDGMCHLIKAQLQKERGQRQEKIQSEQIACFAFRRFTSDDDNQSYWNNCNMLYKLFSLAPCLAG